MDDLNLFAIDPLELKPESETEERKETWNDDDCLKALAAFANSQGGTLRVGVRDNGDILGWNGDGKDQEGISSKIVSVLQVHPASLRIENLQEKPVLAIGMLSAAAPVALRGRYYRRVGNSSREVPQEELPRFLLEKTGQSWDAIPTDYPLTAIDADTVAQFRLLAKERLPEVSTTDTVETVLTKLRLIQNGRLKRAALLLFGNNTQDMSPAAQVQIGRFRDAETILDDRRISGNLLQQLEQVEQTLRQYFLRDSQRLNSST